MKFPGPGIPGGMCQELLFIKRFEFIYVFKNAFRMGGWLINFFSDFNEFFNCKCKILFGVRCGDLSSDTGHSFWDDGVGKGDDVNTFL